MATRQYIGPRFVIKIYENSLDPNSAEWENVVFEPLTMVTYQNSSYLSKKQVPANVGNPVTATDYWVCTGYYNGQISALQTAVAELNTKIGNLANLPTTDKTSIVNSIIEIASDITALTNKYDSRYEAHKYFWLIISDSYAIVPSPTDNWCVEFVNRLGLSSDEYIIVPEDGMGFGNHGFRAALYTAQSQIDTDRPIRIVCCGGFNDGTYLLTNSYSDLITAINDFISNANSVYHNPEIFIGFISYLTDSIMVSRNMEQAFAYALLAYRSVPTNGAIYLNGVEFALRNYALLDSTHFHPTHAGAIAIGSAVFNSIVNGSASDYTLKYSMASYLTLASGTMVGGSINEMYANETCILDIDLLHITSATLNYTGAKLLLLTLNDTNGIFSGSDYCSFYGMVNAHIGGSWGEYIARFTFKNNELKMILVGAPTGTIDELYITGKLVIPSDESFMKAY